MKLPIKYKNNNLDLFNLLWLIWGLETILSITVVISRNSRNFSIQWTYAQTEVVGQIMGKSFNFFIYRVEILLYSYLIVRLWNYHYEIKPSPFILRRWILWYILLSAGPQKYLKQVHSRIGTCSTQSNIFRIEKSEGPMKVNLRNKRRTGISLVVQWWYSLPATAGDMGLIPGPEDSTCGEATKPVLHNYWACTPQLQKATCSRACMTQLLSPCA